jgi:hypothetical protein
MPRYLANAPLEREGKQYGIGDAFDITGMEIRAVQTLIQGGALLVVDDESKEVPEQERVTWQEQS